MTTTPHPPVWEYHDDDGEVTGHLWRHSDGSSLLALTDHTTDEELMADLPHEAAAALAAAILGRAPEETTP